jgi:hypothetical protein
MLDYRSCYIISNVWMVGSICMPRLGDGYDWLAHSAMILVSVAWFIYGRKLDKRERTRRLLQDVADAAERFKNDGPWRPADDQVIRGHWNAGTRLYTTSLPPARNPPPPDSAA